MDFEKILEGLIRVGTVTAIDSGKRLARVKFSDSNITSGWLYVLKSPPAIPYSRTGFTSGGTDEEAFESHSHSVSIVSWMPAVNDTVLVAYLPVFNADGFVLGGI